jgi:hypothetical protein
MHIVNEREASKPEAETSDAPKSVSGSENTHALTGKSLSSMSRPAAALTAPQKPDCHARNEE